MSLPSHSSPLWAPKPRFAPDPLMDPGTPGGGRSGSPKAPLSKGCLPLCPHEPYLFPSPNAPPMHPSQRAPYPRGSMPLLEHRLARTDEVGWI